MNDAIDFSSSLIIYKGKSFPFRVVWSSDYQSDVIISVTSLNDELFDRHDCWVDDIAEHIDSKIIYYVSNEEIQASDEYLQNILKCNIS